MGYTLGSTATKTFGKLTVRIQRRPELTAAYFGLASLYKVLGEPADLALLMAIVQPRLSCSACKREIPITRTFAKSRVTRQIICKLPVSAMVIEHPSTSQILLYQLEPLETSTRVCSVRVFSSLTPLHVFGQVLYAVVFVRMLHTTARIRMSKWVVCVA